MTELTLAQFGLRGKRVRVYRLTTVRGTKLVRCEWREGGKRIRESWPDTRDNQKRARAYGEGVAERLAQRGATRTRITMQELVDRYILANGHWRPKTATNVRDRLRKWLLFAGDMLPAEHTTPEMLDDYRAYLRRTKQEKNGKVMVPNQVAHHAAEVKHLYRFAKARKLVSENPLGEYVIRLSKDEKRADMPEYTNEEWAAILSKLSPRERTHWRSYCLIVLAGVLGPRQKALRHLTWADVDLGTREVTWRPEWDKMGKERTQPLPRAAVRVFRLARVWRARDKYEGEWIFYPIHSDAKPGPYDYSSVIAQLRVAEVKAGVDYIPYRGLHAFRRTSAGNVMALTGGDLKGAGDWIGDTDLKSLRRYLRVRDSRQREVADMVNLPAKAPEQPTEAKA